VLFFVGRGDSDTLLLRIGVISEKMCLLALSYQYTRSHLTNLQTLNESSCNLIVRSFTKNCQLRPSLVKIDA
jgi:hypothetical protein